MICRPGDIAIIVRADSYQDLRSLGAIVQVTVPVDGTHWRYRPLTRNLPPASKYTVRDDCLCPLRGAWAKT